MIIPWRELSSETIQSLVEEFVSRQGTDYGESEISFDTKVKQVRKLLENGEIRIVFDIETQSCDLRAARDLLEPRAETKAGGVSDRSTNSGINNRGATELAAPPPHASRF